MAINYSDLIVDFKNETTITNKPKTKKKTNVTYTVDGVSGCDIVVTRTTTKTRVQLVILISQGQCYTKDLNTGTITKATTETLINYFEKLPASETYGLKAEDAEGNKCCWLNGFQKGAIANAFLLSVITDTKVRDYLKKGYLYLDISKIERNDKIKTDFLPNIKYLTMLWQLFNDKHKKHAITYLSNMTFYNTGGTVNSTMYSKICSII